MILEAQRKLETKGLPFARGTDVCLLSIFEAIKFFLLLAIDTPI